MKTFMVRYTILLYYYHHHYHCHYHYHYHYHYYYMYTDQLIYFKYSCLGEYYAIHISSSSISPVFDSVT